MDSSVVVLLSITFFAACVNGAPGYGFSSRTVPVAIVLDAWLRYAFFKKRTGALAAA